MPANRSERLKNLSPEKRALLLKALRKEAVAAEKSQGIPRRSQQNSAPLSFAQQRLWFLEQLSPGNAAYNLPAAVRLKGQLNLPALQKTFNEIVRRHEVLRTAFAEVDGQTVQITSPASNFTLLAIDLRDLSETEQQTEIEQRAVAEAQSPFDLARPPLLRGSLLQLNSAEYVLLLTIHHLISDGWSMGVLVREVAALYEAFSSGKPSPLPELPMQYADFAIWQRQHVQGEKLDKQLAYWKQQLGGSLAVLSTDRPRPPVPTFRGSQQSFLISAPLTESLKALAQQQDATLYMALLAALKALLYCHTKQENLAIGSPIANRSRVELENIIGFFVNTLVLKIDTTGNPTFRELLGRVREIALAAYAHPDVPFEKLVEELQPERDLSYNPLFQVWFVLQNAPMPPLKLADLTLSVLEFEVGRSRHDLSLTLWEIVGGMQGLFEYKTDLFDAATIARIVRGWKTLLNQVVAQPDLRISDLAEIISEVERQYQIKQEEQLKTSSNQKLKVAKRKGINSSHE
ncbi:MAG: condensation domain-containing protein [Actinomycetota bacterium]